MKREDILSGQAGLEGVQTALTGAHTRSLLRSMAGNLLDQGSLVGRLEITRAKYKPGRKISAFYTAHYQIKDSNQARSFPIAVTWEKPYEQVTAPDDLARMQADILQHNLLSPFRQLWSGLPDLGMRLKIWPLDVKFPQLPRVSDPDYMRSFFQSIPAAAAVTGEAIDVTPIRYRPGERHVLRYNLCAERNPPLPSDNYYIKLYREGKDAARAYRIAIRIVDWLDSGPQEVKGARPVGFSEEEALIVYPHVPGTPLSHLLLDPNPLVAGYLQSIGEALSFIHTGPDSLAAELEENTFDQEVKAVLRSCEHIRVLLPEAWDEILRVTSLAQEMYAAVPKERSTFTHSDFKADHLFAGSGRLTLIDFDTCSLADPAIDVGKFLADLEWWFVSKGKPGIEEAQQQFLDGYGHMENKDRITRARLFQLLIMIKIAARRVPLFSKDWAVITNRMIVRAVQALEMAAPQSRL